MSDETPESIQVNFGRPMALFPLDETLLLPHGVLPLHIFEPRYRQMLHDVLDGAGQFAMASFEGDRWREEYHGRPPLKPAVCVAQIVRDEKLEDGRYNILLQGLCRAEIVEELAPDGDKLYRRAMLRPLESDEVDPDDEFRLAEPRRRVAELLGEPPLTRFVDAAGKSIGEGICGYIERDEIPTTVILDLVGQWMVKAPKVRYQLLSESDPLQRSRALIGELEHVRSLMIRAERQIDPDAPKGVRWN